MSGPILERERTSGLASEFLTASQARGRIPILVGSRVVAATWAPGDAKINPLLACRALAHAAVRAGAELRTGSRVLRVAPERGRWRLDTTRGPIDTDAVVVACGPWTGGLLADLEPRLREAIRPQRAQCCVTHRLPAVIGPIVSSTSTGISAGYTQLHQTRHGEIMFNTVADTSGTRSDDERLHDHVDYDFLVVSARTLVDLFPTLRGARLLRAWAAFEAWTPDRRFLIGRVGPEDGLYVAAGDSGIGFIKAPMVARAIASQIRDEDCGFDLSRYAPLRSFDATT